MNTNTTLPLNTLRIDPVNVRTIGRGDEDAALKASLKAYGVKLPLIVRQGGDGHLVYVGGRRLEQLQALAQEGAVAADYPVPVIVEDVNDAQARQVSLAENIIRRAMHPVDEYRAFAAMNEDREQPLEPEMIAARFGLSARHVAQRLALGKLHPLILDAWRDGHVMQEVAQAFTLCADLKHQAKLYRQLAKEGRLSAYTVRHALKLGQDNPGRLLAVVGQQAYEARGGKVQVDLFGEDHVVSDPELLGTMVEELVSAEVGRLEADGWSFVLTGYPDGFYRWGDIEPALKPTPDEKAQRAKLRAMCDGSDADEREAARQALAALDDSIALRSYTAKQKARSGCIVALDDEGRIIVLHGKVRPEAAKPVKEAAVPAAKAKAKEPALSQALRQRLAAQLAQATKDALLADKHPNALAALNAKIIASMIVPEQPSATPQRLAQHMEQIRTAITAKVLNEAAAKSFEAKDFFACAPKLLVVAAVAEALGKDEASKAAGKTRTDLAKFCVARVVKTGWLPPELRTVHYDGPGKAKLRKAA